MRWIEWEYIKKNEEHYPGVYDSFKSCEVDKFVGQKLTKWNDELIMQFYSTHYKKDTSVTFWAERIFFCHTYDTSMTIIVTKPGIIIDVVGSYFYDKKS